MRASYFMKATVGVLLISFIVVGCKKEDVSPDFQKMTFDGQEVLDKLPAGLTNSADDYAKECISMINSALDMSEFIDDMDVPEDAEKAAKKGSGDTWSWSISVQGYLYTFYWTYSEDNVKHYWTMEIQVDGGTKHAYIQAWENKDGSGGEVKYNFNWVAAVYGYTEYEDIFWTYNWTLDGAGNYHFIMTWDSGYGADGYYLTYEVVVNDDGSGSIEYWLMNELVYEMEWDALGNGTWTYYSGGVEMTSGSWSAA